MGTNTGNGGFEIDGKTYDFDVGPTDATGIAPVEVDHGDLRVDDTIKDISKKTKITLAKYLSDATLGKDGSAKGTSNRFPIQSHYAEISISDTTTGFPSIQTEGDPKKQFTTKSAAAGTVSDSPELRQFSNTVVADPLTTLSELSKGKQSHSLSPIDGNVLLSKSDEKPQQDVILGYQSLVLKNNRFNDAAQSAAFLSGLKNDNTKNNDYNPTLTIRGTQYTQDKLAQVGAMLSLRGSQEFPAAFNDKVNPTGAGSAAGALLPSPNQLGILKISNKILEARDALEHLSNDAVSPDAMIEISPIGDQSWGALNNVEEHWSGLLNIGMVAMALAMQAALLLAFEGIGALVSLGGVSKINPPVRDDKGFYVKGSYSKPPKKQKASGFSIEIPNIGELLGLHGTIYPFGDALQVGATAFFVGAENAKKGSSLGNALLSAVSSAVGNALSDSSSAGFIIIVSRMIIRSGQTVAADVSKIGKAFASNPISGIQSIVGLIENFKHSKLIAAMNVFSTLGDAILTEEQNESKIDEYDDNVASSNVKKNRLTGISKLAWASNRSPASYLIPDSVLAMQLVDTKLGGFIGASGLTDPYSKTSTPIITESGIPGRLSQDDVQKMESVLDAEYMPFYFHDLRTNEIISFHAFIASMSDNYTANWESIDGYGRVDPIKIYRSTARHIDISFYIAALDVNDFDDMWVKINKLITLVYPQYTKGRSMKEGTQTSFVQPFSQLIGASPLVRIRLGDLFRSNYSRFALARLFGAADNDMVLEGSPIKFGDSEKVLLKLNELTKKALKDSKSKFTLSVVGWGANVDAGGAGIGLKIPIISGPSAPDQAPTLNIDGNDLAYFYFNVQSSTDVSANVKVNLYSESELKSQNKNADVQTLKTTIKNLNKKYNSDDNIKQKVIDKVYTVPLSQLRLSSEALNNLMIEAGASAETATTSIKTLSDFLDVKNNAIVKSFHSVQGKGLAGAIESINFDWYDKVTWEIVAPGYKAPKMCKVTLAFAPIHDISPGLDHMGYNRAPIYPVGTAMGNKRDDS